MKTISLACAILLLAACTPAPKPADTSASAAPAATPAPTASFAIGKLDQDQTDIMGCTTMLSRPDDGQLDYVFLEGAGDNNSAHGFMRIDGTVIQVDQTTQTEDEAKHTLKTLYASKDGKLSVVEDLVIGEAHQESDSVDLSGALTVTYKGMIQTVPVTGGTAC